MMLAYLGRNAHQPISDLLALPVRWLMNYGAALHEVLEREQPDSES